MYPHLSGSGRVNVSLIQEAAIKELLAIFERCDGSTKAIVWDESLAGPVGLIAKHSFLKEHNVIKMFPLRSGSLPDVDVKNVIFITRADLRLMEFVASNIHNEQKRVNKKDFYLYFLPHKSLLCEKHLKNKGVHGSFQHIGEFNCEFFPIDSDVISMELRDSFKDLCLDGDYTSIHHAALGLVTLQKLYGRIPKVYGKGSFARNVWDLTKTLTSQDASLNDAKSANEKSLFDQMILIDRQIDFMSSLATQLTYSGLIDEVFGISNNIAQFPEDRFTKSGEASTPTMTTGSKKQIILNSSEDLYAELRDQNFNAVGQTLSRHAKYISAELDKRHEEKSVQEMKKFVERLPTLLASKQSLSVHTTIAELVREHTSTNRFLDELQCEQEFMECSDIDKPCSFIEDLIAKEAPLPNVLRLICMQSIAASGLKPKVYDYYKRELVQVYGIRTLLTLGNLEKAGLLGVQTGSRSFAVLRKTLNLTVNDVAEIAPKDISYVHSFYAPLSIRIVEQIIKPGGWPSLVNILTGFLGETFEETPVATNPSGRRSSLTSEISQSDIPKVILVFFVGGCTLAEISALRFLAQQDDNNVEFVIATTKLINKNTFLENFIEN